MRSSFQISKSQIFSVDPASIAVALYTTLYTATYIAIAIAVSVSVSTSTYAFAQANSADAKTTAKNEQSNNKMLGGVTVAAGAALMAYSCPFALACDTAVVAGGVCNCAIESAPVPCTVVCFAVGPGLIGEGVVDLTKSSARDQTINPLNAANFNAPPCELDPTNPLCSHQYDANGKPVSSSTNPLGQPGSSSDNLNGNAGSQPNGSPNLNSLPPAIAAALQEAKDAGAKAGFDPTNPASIKAAQSKHGLTGNEASEMSGLQLSPALLSAVEKAKTDMMQKLNAPSSSSVGFEGGGGGRGGYGSHGKNGFSKNSETDLSALLKQLNPGGEDRGIASIDGLQKNFHGDAIGVARGNIFTQVTKRYQKKIQDQTVSSNNLH
jgi:hypothetical protein